MEHRIGHFKAVVMLLSIAVVAASGHLWAQQEPGGSCLACHDDLAAVLPPDHEVIPTDTIGACLSCHRPERLSPRLTAPFATRLHLAHLPPRGGADCLVCHSLSAGKAFGLLGEQESWGAPSGEEWQLLKEIMGSWASSDFLDRLHKDAKVSCGACHGASVPGFDATVGNARCLSCHGPMEQLATKTEPPDFKDRNPHRSHLGEIDCTVCHKAHGQSKVYCLGCHQKFVMHIPGAGQAQDKQR